MKRKFSGKADAVDQLLARMSYEYIYTPDRMDETLFKIRDVKDYPVLYTAILDDADIFVTGDDDFTDVDIERPKIMTPAEFVKKYCEYDGN